MFQGRIENRIIAWRDFRHSLKSWPNDIQRVAEFWAKAPLSNNYLTYENPKEWPDPWCLIKDGIYCDISIALGMFYTLYYSDYDKKNIMSIECFKNVEKQEILNLVNLEQGKYMLNFHVGRSVNKTELGQLGSPIYTVTYVDLPIKI